MNSKKSSRKSKPVKPYEDVSLIPQMMKQQAKKAPKEFTVENLLDRRYFAGKYQYLVKWEGYPLAEATWEPLRNLDNVMEMVESLDEQLERSGVPGRKKKKESKRKSADSSASPSKTKSKSPKKSFAVSPPKKSKSSASPKKKKSKKSSSEDEYIVETILDRRLSNGSHEYLVKWQGYPKSDSTWEPLDNLMNVLELVQEFNEQWDEIHE